MEKALTALTVTKSAAALRQVSAAISAFWQGDHDIAITLALAAEGMAESIPDSLFQMTADDPRRPDEISKKVWISAINGERDWLKHPTTIIGDEITIGTEDAAYAIVRGMQRWEPWTQDMILFKAWYLVWVNEHNAAPQS